MERQINQHSKDPLRQYKGERSRTAGKNFENRLTQTFDYYKARGYAYVEKTPEPMKVLRSLEQGRFMCCFEKKAQPDYKGTLKGGRTVMYEAKFTESDRLTQDRVSPEQSAYLDRHYDLGARCFILAGFSSGNVYCVPWPTWRDMKAKFGRKYVKETDLADYAVKTAWNGTLMILD